VRTIFKTGMILVAVAAAIAVAVWVFYAQRQDDIEADKAEGIGAPLTDSLAAPADTAAAWSDTTATSGP